MDWNLIGFSSEEGSLQIIILALASWLENVSYFMVICISWWLINSPNKPNPRSNHIFIRKKTCQHLIWRQFFPNFCSRVVFNTLQLVQTLIHHTLNQPKKTGPWEPFHNNQSGKKTCRKKSKICMDFWFQLVGAQPPTNCSFAHH